MRSHDGTDDVVRVLDARHPVAHRFVNRIAKRSRPALDRPDFGTEQLHAENIRCLPPNVFGAHVHDAGQAEVGTSGRRGDTMLAGTGLGDDARLTHPQSE